MLENNAVQTKLTPQQNERINFLIPSYGLEVAQEIVVNYISSKGINSWPSFQGKLSVIKRSDYRQKEYEDSMYDAFELDQDYSIEEIIQKVTSVRSDMDLPSYVERIKVKSISDFLNLFIVEKIHPEGSNGTKKKEIGYKPVYRIKP